MTIFDSGRLTDRLAPEGWNVPARLFPLDQEAFKACLASKEVINLEKERMQVEATYVDEGRVVIRVILFLEGEES